MTRLATRGTLLRNGLWDHALVMAHYEAACAEVDAECEEGLAADSATGINTFQARQEDVKGTEDTARTDIPPPAQCVPSPAAQPPADSSNTLSTASREHSGRVTAPVVAVAVQDSLDPARVESLLGRSLLAKLVPLPSSPADEVNVIRVSPDGALLATGGTRGVLRVWAAHPAPPGATFTPRRLPRNSSSMRAAPLVWAPGTPPVGAGATSLGAGSSTRWQEGSRGACSALLAELHGHVAPITAITFLHGPRIMLVTGGADESLRMWDLSALLAPESSPDAVPHILTLPPPGSNPLPLPPSPSQLWSDGHNEQHHRQQYCDRQHNISARQHQEMTPGGEDNDSGSTSMEDPDVLGDVPSSGRKAAVGWVQEPATFLPPVSPSNQADARVQTGENADLVRQSYRTGSLHRLRNARELASVGRATYAGATVLRPPNIAPHLHTTPRVVPPSPSALERAHAFDHIANTITDRREGVLGVRPANPLVAVLAGHEGTITALDASPDGLQVRTWLCSSLFYLCLRIKCLMFVSSVGVRTKMANCFTYKASSMHIHTLNCHDKLMVWPRWQASSKHVHFCVCSSLAGPPTQVYDCGVPKGVYGHNVLYFEVSMRDPSHPLRSRHCHRTYPGRTLLTSWTRPPPQPRPMLCLHQARHRV